MALHSPAGIAAPQNVYQTIAAFARPSLGKAIWQLTVTLLLYAFLWGLMILTIREGVSYWWTLALAIPAAGLQIRIFIFFHDCCHGSFFASRRSNRLCGYITGVLTFTPFEQWRRSHAEHHATVGDLDRRGMGDIWTLTVEEYQKSSRFRRFAYRLVRNPLAMLFVGPLFLFGYVYRITPRDPKQGERFSVWFTNIMLLAVFVVAWLTIGWQTYLLVQLPIIYFSGMFGVWLFYIQHQFEGVYWARHDSWDPLKAALEGSSYYRLPRVIQWFTGNIGLHHIHHAQPRIPNYRLQQCLDEVPVLQTVNRLTLRDALFALRLRLWDEQAQKMVGFNR